MADANSTLRKDISIETNPFLIHGTGIEGLINNLRNSRIADNDVARLEAIRTQAGNVGECADLGIRYVSTALAVALDSGELDSHAAQQVAWAIQFLSELSTIASTYLSEANMYLINPSMWKELNHGQA